MTDTGQSDTQQSSTEDRLQGSGLQPDFASWHATVAYDGTAFRGWQIQPDLRTVQGELQKRVRLIFRQPELRLSATSRTDAGVHALDQHVSFSAPQSAELTPERVRQTLNRWLPEDVQVRSIELARSNFSARYDCIGKAYTYVVCTGEKCHPLFSRFVWHLQRTLALDDMQEAATHLVGEHDFSSFAVNPKREIATNVRRLHRVEVSSSGDFVFFNVVGEGFLYKMVRSIVGYLVFVGRGAARTDDIVGLLQARDRCASAYTGAPGRGLFLAKAFFDGDSWPTYKPILPPFAWQG